MNWNSVPVLVTGGAGFIGSHLVERLVILGAHVTVIDNLSTGSLDNLATVMRQITFINADIADYQSMHDACRQKKVLFHLAAVVSVSKSIKNPGQCHRTNVFGTLNLLQAGVAHNVQKLIFSSSSAVYGSTNEIVKEDSACNPQSPYGHSKLLAESICKYFTTHFGMTTYALRYFNVYGPRQNPEGPYAAVVAKFKALMAQNKPLYVFGDGLQTRDFICVEEIVKANIELAQNETITGHEIFNIGSGKSITLLDLVEKLKHEFPDFNAGIQFMPSRMGDIPNSQADCDKYRLYTSS